MADYADDHPIRAGILGAARGLTFGLSDELLDTPVQRENAKLLKSENPLASGASEIAGSIGSVVALPELGVAKGAAGVAGRLAAEGGLLGLGREISEAALDDREINKELLATDVLRSAGENLLFGGALHGAGALTSKALGKAGEFFASDAVKGAASTLRSKTLKKALGLDDAALKYADEAGLLASTSHEGVASLAGEAQRRSGNKALEAADGLLSDYPDLAPFLEKWGALANESGPQARQAMRKIESEIRASLSPAQKVEEIVAKEVEKAGRPVITPQEFKDLVVKVLSEKPATAAETRVIAAKAVKSAPKARSNARTVIDESGAETRVAEGIDETQFGNSVMYDKTFAAKTRVEPGVEDTLVKATGPQGKDIKDLLRGLENDGQKLNPAYVDNAVTSVAPLEEATASASKSVAKGTRNERRLVENTPVPVTEILERPNYAEMFNAHADEFHKASQVYDAAIKAFKPLDIAGIASEAVVPGIFGGPKAVGAIIGSRMAKQIAEQRGGLILGKGLEKIAEGKILPKVFDAFQARVDYMVQNAPGLLGPFATVLANASQEGPEALAAVHSKLAQGPQGGEYLARMGLTPETSEETRAYGQKLAMLEALEAQKAQFEKGVDRSVKSLFGGAKPEFEPGPKVSKKDFEGQVEKLRKMIQDPIQVAKHVPSDVLQGAPALSVQAGQQALAAAQFLYERAPKPADAWKPKALQLPFEPAPGDLDKWYRYAEAVQNPMFVANKMARGESSPEAVEAVKTLYPSMFAQLQQRVMTQLVSIKKPLPYDKKVLLAEIFGPQMLGVGPEAALYLQAVHKAGEMEGQQNLQKGSSGDGRQMVNQNKNMQTQTQRIEARGQGQEA